MRIVQTWTLSCATWDIPVQKSTRFYWDNLAPGHSENPVVISRQEQSKTGLVHSLALAILSPPNQSCHFPVQVGEVLFPGGSPELMTVLCRRQGAEGAGAVSRLCACSPLEVCLSPQYAPLSGCI